MKPEAIAQIEALQAAAVQIQQWDFAGWGNTSNYAADYIAAQDAEIAQLREALLRSKSLISDVYSMLPEQAIAARQVIDKRTGAWFVFGVDREALTTKGTE